MATRILIPLLATFLLGTASAQPGLVHHWPLDESSGGSAQEIIGGQHGSLLGGVLWSPDGGRHGGAARFDGVDDRIVAGPCDLTNGGNGITLALWVKPDFVTAMDRTIMAKTSGPQAGDAVWSVTFINATALRFRLRTGGTVAELTTAPSSIFSGTWYHVVASYDGQQMRLYVNGALMGSMARSGTIGHHPAVNVSMGALAGGTQPFSGWLDDVRIYDRGLSDMEIIQLLFADVTTGLHAEVLTLLPDGVLLPAGEWERITLHDVRGRLVLERSILRHEGPVSLGAAPPSMYVLTLHGRHERRAQQVLLR